VSRKVVDVCGSLFWVPFWFAVPTVRRWGGRGSGQVLAEGSQCQRGRRSFMTPEKEFGST
jgi:hypothetical protein